MRKSTFLGARPDRGPGGVRRRARVPVVRRGGAAGIPRSDGRHHAVPGGADAASARLRQHGARSALSPTPWCHPAIPAPAPAGSRRRAGRPVGLLAHARRHDARPTDRRGDPGQSRRARRGSTRAGRARGAHRGGARLRADGHGRRRLHPPAARRARRFRSARAARSPTRTSGTAASTRRGSWTCSAGCGAASRRKARSSARRARTCATCRCRSPPRWHGPTSSCAALRSGWAWRDAMPTTSAALSR